MMNRILIVEDNSIKMDKIKGLFTSLSSSTEIDTAGSFNSGWKLIQKNKNKYDLIVLDLSLPSFDTSVSIDSGEFRSLGGKELAHKLVKRNIMIPFIFLTAYSVFDDKVYKYTFDELKLELLKKYPEQCLGFVFYNNKSSEWRKEITDVVRGLK